MKTPFEKVSVIGLGYIGLPTGAVLASYGVGVIGVDVNKSAVDTINQGRVHIVEPDLDAIVQTTVNSGKLKATTEVKPAQAFIIAVPTPFREGHKPDLSFVESAAKSIAPVLEKGNLVVLESTSPVGATESVCRWLAELRPDLSFPYQAGEKSDIQVAYCPERVLPGHILRELVENDRVIGGITPNCAQQAASLYRIFVRGECILTNARTAEMTKLTENSFRDVNIAFANELANICEDLEINVWELIRLANRHPRVKILQPGPGVGGHCIAVDPWFIVDSCPEKAKLIKTAREVNDARPHAVVRKIKEKAGLFKTPVIACLGLSFKADIDDLRESPAMEIVSSLAKERLGRILAVEPYLEKLPSSLSGFPELHLTDMETALTTADIVVLLVNHKEFAYADRALLKNKIVIDTRGAWL